MGDSSLHKTMSRQIAEMCARFGYMKLCVETDLNVGEVWLQLPVCRQRSEQRPISGYSIVPVFEVTKRSVSISLW